VACSTAPLLRSPAQAREGFAVINVWGALLVILFPSFLVGLAGVMGDGKGLVQAGETRHPGARPHEARRGGAAIGRHATFISTSTCALPA